MEAVAEYYDADTAPHEALGRFARRLASGGALYLGGGVGVEKVRGDKGETYKLTKAGDAKGGESFSGPLSAVMRAFSTAGASNAPDTPGGSQAVTDPAIAARLRELTDEERELRKSIERSVARLAAKPAPAPSGLPSPSSVDDASWETRRIAEDRRRLAQIAVERVRLLSTGVEEGVQEVEQARPGTNWKQIPKQNVAKLKGIIDHYRGMAHPFTACVADQVKHGLSQDHANRRCAVVKDLAMKTTKWRKGGKAGKVSEELELLLNEAYARVQVVEDGLGTGMAFALAEGLPQCPPELAGLEEAMFADIGLLALAGEPVAEMLFESFSWSKFLHPRGGHGKFRQTFGRGNGVPRGRSPALPKPEPSAPPRPDGQTVIKPGGPKATPRHKGEGKAHTGATLGEKELTKGVGSGAWTPRANAVAQDLIAGRVRDTEMAHRSNMGKGPYSAKRIELHRSIVRKMLQGAGAHPEDAHAYFMAGGPASGKSTTLKTMGVPKDAVLINPDVVRQMLPEYSKLVAAGDPAASAKTHEEASMIAKQVQNLAMARRHHILLDTVGSGPPGKFAGKVTRAIDNGYSASVHYTTIPTDEALVRAKRRAAKPVSKGGGRHVPEWVVRDGHAEASARFPEVVDIAGVDITVHDNSGKKLKLIASRRAPGKKLIVHDENAYNEFLAKARERG